MNRDQTATDEMLVASVLQGNQAAFRQIVERYTGLLMNIARNKGVGHEDQKDVVQHTFLTVYNKLSSYEVREGASFKSRICAIGQNAANNLRRSRMRKREVSSQKEDHDFEQVVRPSEQPIDQMIQAEELAEAEQAKSVVWTAIEELRNNPKYKRGAEYCQFLVLRYSENLSYEQIAACLKITIGKAYQWDRQAIEALQRIFQASHSLEEQPGRIHER